MTRKVLDYATIDLPALTLLLGKNMPQGLAWNGKTDVESNIYKLFNAMASQIRALEDRVFRMATQFNPASTTDLLVEWETAVGIPDECRKRAELIQDRRDNVLTKLKKTPIVTIADYQALAEVITGEPAATWNIRPGSQDFPAIDHYRFILFVGSPQQAAAKFTLPFGNDNQLSVSSLTRSGSTATATVSDTSDMVDGSDVEISGAVETDYNGFFTITITSGTTFDYIVAGTPTTPATGTILVDFGRSLPDPTLDVNANEVFIDDGILFEGYPFAGTFRTDVLQCVFRKVSPANIDIVFD